ncbi:MAG: polynucleotide adenylyltransferase PcnB [Legionellales bacterium]|nr:polynucleotide adenylyltransferase PcnB [Legionellales bacterium]
MKSPFIIPREQHTLSRRNVSENALKVLYRLKEHGFAAFLVGGSVRDLLLGRTPKDFDVATDARPDDIRKIFRNCRLIGRRFRLAHIHFNQDIIEVATFRSNAASSDDDRSTSESGMILRDNVYGTMEEDAWRRDFTINALYYNIADFSVVDYTKAMEDLKHGIVRLIGEPERRYREDPVRMLRAIRFCAKLNMQMHPTTEEPIYRLQHLLSEISPARLFEETLKLFQGGAALNTYRLLRQYHLFHFLLPLTEDYIQKNPDYTVLLETAFTNTDKRISEDKPVTPAFLFAVSLWGPLQNALKEFQQQHSASQAMDLAIEKILKIQTRSITIPRRISSMMIDIWKLQYRLPNCQGSRAWRILSHRRFRAAYDFLMILATHDKTLEPLANWWTEFQVVSTEEQKKMTLQVPKLQSARPPKRKKG